jgi:hypothetical protein
MNKNICWRFAPALAMATIAHATEISLSCTMHDPSGINNPVAQQIIFDETAQTVRIDTAPAIHAQISEVAISYDTPLKPENATTTINRLTGELAVRTNQHADTLFVGTCTKTDLAKKMF